MPDEPGANLTPPSPAEPALNGIQTNPAAEPLNPVRSVPFHQDPQIQDYIRRQEDRIRQEERNRYLASQPSLPPAAVDPLAGIRADMDAKVKSGTITADDIIQSQKKIAEIIADEKVKSSVSPIQERMGEVQQRERLNNVASKVGAENWNRTYPKMMEIYNQLSPQDKSLISNSNWALESLYEQAAKLAPLPSPTQNPQSGTSVPNRSGNRLPAGNDDVSKASAALVSKDKKAFGEAIRRMQ